MGFLGDLADVDGSGPSGEAAKSKSEGEETAGEGVAVGRLELGGELLGAGHGQGVE